MSTEPPPNSGRGLAGTSIKGPFAIYNKLAPVRTKPAGLSESVSDADRAAWEKDYEALDTRLYIQQHVYMPTGNGPDFLQYVINSSQPQRPGLNSTGKEAALNVNMHVLNKYPSFMVHQYDIIITGERPGTEKRGLIKAIWECPTMRKTLGGAWIWNGDKIAWSTAGLPQLNDQNIPVKLQQQTIHLDLDAEKAQSVKTGQKMQQARAPRGDAPTAHSNRFTVQIRYTKSVNLAAVWAFLTGQSDFNDAVLESITLLNHIMREMPSRNMNAFKNSFFPKTTDSTRYDLGQGVYALKGAFQSIRMAYQGRLMVNVDVAHSTFYIPQRLDHMAAQVLMVASTGQMLSIIQKAQPNPPYGAYKDSPGFKKLQTYLRKLKFRVQYPGVSEKTKSRRFIVKNISYDTSRSHLLDFNDRKTGQTKQMSVQQYFKDVYNYHLEQPALPLVETTKKGVYYPMEVCVVEDGQRYPFKLDERQTADMIKFAVSRPADRMKAIQTGLKGLDWGNDKVLQHFKIQINAGMVETKARVLDAPKVMFGDNKFEAPGTAGRWRIDGKKFYKVGKPLKNWGVCIVEGGRNQREAVSDQEAMKFVNNMIAIYKGHGGVFANPHFATCKASENDTAAAVDTLINAMRARGLGQKEYPDLMIFILPRKNTETYQRLKRCADLKWGSVSQCVQAAHVKKNQAQYISNVLMKINAKLGGASYKAVPISGPLAQRGGRYFTVPTMIIGADVSHPSPGSLGSSMAALTVSMDREAIRYGASVQSNGHRLEMITTWNWNDMLGPMAREWISSVGAGRFPQHIYYFRDGVSEGQYQHVIHQEVRDMYNVFKSLDPSANGQNVAGLKFTVVVCSKRHHIRLFPRNGTAACDRNGNAVPGTLVEKDVTSVRDYDFYLNSHSAIQGTARPCHYAVIMDQANVAPNILENMIYEHCYQYVRSSTPVSLYPAVYYAHLASRRAVAHERTGRNFAAHRSSEQKERYMLLRARAEADITGKIMTTEALAKLKEYTTNEYPPCIPTCNTSLWFNMWYI